MIDVKQLEKDMDGLLRPPKWRKITTAKVPTWALGLDEGIEIKDGKLVGFWVKEGERVYGEPPSAAVESVLTQMQPQDKPKPEQQPPEAAQHAEVGLQPVLLPEQITMPLIEKWKKLSTFERILMFQKTAKDNIEERPGPGGKKMKYVKGNFMLQEANIAFLFSWSSKIEGWDIRPDAVSCYGSVSTEIEGKLISRSAVGIDIQQQSNGKAVFTVAELMKNAHTDMIKKGLASMGFNGDVYRGEV